MHATGEKAGAGQVVSPLPGAETTAGGRRLRGGCKEQCMSYKEGDPGGGQTQGGQNWVPVPQSEEDRSNGGRRAERAANGSMQGGGAEVLGLWKSLLHGCPGRAQKQGRLRPRGHLRVYQSPGQGAGGCPQGAGGRSRPGHVSRDNWGLGWATLGQEVLSPRSAEALK